MNKIVQILIGPNDSKWQGNLIGLAENGSVYYLTLDGEWKLMVESPVKK